MQARINHFLNRRFPYFLWNEKGIFYYFIMTVIFAGLANVTKPFGFGNWNEYHRSMVLTNFIFLFFGMYPVVHFILKFIRPVSYNRNIWTRKKELQVLLFFFPIINVCSCVYADFAIAEFELTNETLLDVLLYNSTLSFVSVPTFGFFIDKTLNPSQPIQLIVLPRAIEPIKPIGVPQVIQPIELTQPTNAKKKTKSKTHLTEEQALNIIQKLNKLMETKQLYLSKKCSEQQVAGISGFSLHNISEALNSYSHKNFSEFINGYRCKHACQLLEKNIPKRLNIEVIGEKCGFQNRVSFQKAFKKIYGISPSEYQERVNRDE